MPRCGDILPEGVICGCCHSMSHCGTSPKSLKNLNGCSMNPNSLNGCSMTSLSHCDSSTMRMTTNCDYLTSLSRYGSSSLSLTMTSATTSLSHCDSSSLTSLCGCPKSCCGSLSQSLSKCLGLW